MKFSIPFFGKRKTDDSSAPQGASGEPTSASTSSPAHERVTQPVAPEGEKKPFVVPESTKAMPSFSQAEELAGLEEKIDFVTRDPDSNKKPEVLSDTTQDTTSLAKSQTVRSNSSSSSEDLSNDPEESNPAENSVPLKAQDIIAAYKIFLKRFPESKQNIDARVGLTADRNLFDFLGCEEFMARKDAMSLVVYAANQMLQVHRKNLSTTDSEQSSTTNN